VVAFDKSENILRRAFTTNKSRLLLLSNRQFRSIRQREIRKRAINHSLARRRARRRGFFSSVSSSSSFIKGILLDSLLRILSSPIRLSLLITSPGIIFHALMFECAWVNTSLKYLRVITVTQRDAASRGGEIGNTRVNSQVESKMKRFIFPHISLIA